MAVQTHLKTKHHSRFTLKLAGQRPAERPLASRVTLTSVPEDYGAAFRAMGPVKKLIQPEGE